MDTQLSFPFYRPETHPITKDHSSDLIQLLSSDLDFHDQPSNYSSHNFHSFPAKFPPQLPQKFIESLTSIGDVVLDPMAGSGTTLLEAYLSQRKAIGFDIDPLALRISRVKTSPLDRNKLMKTGYSIIKNATRLLSEKRVELLEQISNTFDPQTKAFIDQWFLPDTQLELMALLNQIQEIEEPAVRDFFEIAFSAIIITKSGGVSLALDLGHTRPHIAKSVTNKAGKLLYGDSSKEMPNYMTKVVRPALFEFEKRYQQNLDGILKSQENEIKAEITFGNAQDLPLPDNSVDLIVTSPPYASNAIDYMRAHKFSLVWFGYSINDLSKKRAEYIGGEKLTNQQFEILPITCQSVITSITSVDLKKGMVLRRYYSEMQRVLSELYRVLKPGKVSIMVVGNSIMRAIDTETPGCLAEIGQNIGFEVPAIGVRHLDRNKRMMPAGTDLNLDSQIQQRMHEEYVIGFYKPK